MLHVLPACSRCTSMVHVQASSQCCFSILHVSDACSCNMYVHAPCLRYMLLSILLVLAAFPRCISALYAHVHAARHVLSYQSSPGSLSWHSYSVCTVLLSRFFLSHSACPVMPVIYASLVLPVLSVFPILRSCSSCPVLAYTYMTHARNSTIAKKRSVKN